MASYTDQFKAEIVSKMMPPNARKVAEISRETGVSSATLYTWRNRFRQEGHVVPANSSNPERWSGDDKLAVIIEIAALNEQELSAYCRSKGLYADQIAQWRLAGVAGMEAEPVASKRVLQQERKQRRKLEKALQRKEKALAEAAALLVLGKKTDALWGEDEDV